MQNAAASKKKRWLAVVVAGAIVVGLMWLVSYFLSFNQEITQKLRVGDNYMLYVTEGSAGATTADVYRYYVVEAGVNDNDFLTETNRLWGKYPAFLSTSDRDAKIEVDALTIKIALRGDVYKFDNGEGYPATIYLNAAPY